MSFFNDLKIEKKMMAAFAVVVAAIAIMGMIVFIQINALEKARHDRVRASAVQREAESAMVYLARQESSFRAYLLSRDDYHLQKMAKERQEFNAILERIARMDSRSANDVRSARRSADAWAKSVIEASQSGGAITTTMIGINSATASGSTSIAAVEAELKTLTEAKAEQSKLFGQRQEAVEKQARLVLILGMVFALAMAVGAGFILTQMLGKPLMAMTSAMRRLAAGDTSILIPAIGRRDEVGEMASAVQAFKDAALDKARLEAEAEAERAAARAIAEQHEAMKAEENAASQTAITALNEALSALSKGDLTYRITAHMTRAGSLKDDFNKAAEQLEEAIGEVLHNVVAIRSGSGEISQASDDLSRRTEQQAASLEETAAALDEITATVNRTAEGARQASSVVQSARGDAEQSGQVVRDAVAAMGQIEASSSQISNIIGVIDEIAFQTNLLALNAGVEAARAGDAGRGFAVVASEVRALAQRSAEAAKEIKSLISASSRQVGSGVNLVGQTGEALQRIVSRVAEIDSLVSEIAASAQEQATGLQQVNSAVNQMDQVTQQNAAMVEETTAASHSLAREAGSLNNAVQRFRTREVHRLAQAPQVAAPAPAKARAPVAAPSIAPVASNAEVRPEPTPAATSRQAQPVAETLAALKTVGRGGAALKPQAIEDGWEEF